MNKPAPLLSIIIPAYNAEKTLRRCLDSVLDQGNAKIQVIISNDGSTDDTQNIIEKYAARDSRVIGIRDVNGGLSCARNRGIMIAAGQYITFLDSDDYVDPKIYEEICDILAVHQPDMLDYQFSVSISDTDYPNTMNALPKDVLLDKRWLADTIIPVLLNISPRNEFFIESFVWNKVYNSEILRKHNVLFDESRRKWEDRLFSITFLQYANTYYSMSSYGYHYVCGNSQTLSGRFDPTILRIIVDSYQKYRQMYDHAYCFDNAYTTNYFCELLINVAKDQFAYSLPSDELKEMFSIFSDNSTVQKLFSNCTLSGKDMRLICGAIRAKNVNSIYLSLNRYASRLNSQQRAQQYWKYFCALLSRIRRMFIHAK